VGPAGDCSDPAIGGPFGNFMTCNLVFVNNSTDWRCMCNALMLPQGPECSTADTFQLVLLVSIFGALVLLNAATVVFAGGVVHSLLRVNKFKPNPAIISTSLMTAACTTESIRFALYVFRNLPTTSGVTIPEAGFHFSLYVVLGGAIVTIAEGLMSLALAWIRVAEQSSSLKQATSASLKWIKFGTRLYMVGLACVVAAMMASGMALQSALVGAINCVFLLPFLVYGGMKLRQLVGPVKPVYGKTHMSFVTSEEQRGGEGETAVAAETPPAFRRPDTPGSLDLNAAVRLTYLAVAGAMLVFLIGVFWMFTVTGRLFNEGVLRWGGAEATLSFGLIGGAVWGIASAVIRFFYVCNRNSVRKIREQDRVRKGAAAAML